jgi:hypothetical protein
VTIHPFWAIKVTISNIVVPENIAAIASKLFFELGGAPSVKPIGIQGQLDSSRYPTNTGQSNFTFSPKHNGLALYVSRILRPIWKALLVVQRYL